MRKSWCDENIPASNDRDNYISNYMANKCHHPKDPLIIIRAQQQSLIFGDRKFLITAEENEATLALNTYQS